MIGTLYLIPNTLGDVAPLETMPISIKKIIEQIANFPIFFAAIVETLLFVTNPLSSIQNPAAINPLARELP